jgi:hypothetical protein
LCFRFLILVLLSRAARNRENDRQGGGTALQ